MKYSFLIQTFHMKVFYMAKHCRVVVSSLGLQSSFINKRSLFIACTAILSFAYQLDPSSVTFQTYTDLETLSSLAFLMKIVHRMQAWKLLLKEFCRVKKFCIPNLNTNICNTSEEKQFFFILFLSSGIGSKPRVLHHNPNLHLFLFESHIKVVFIFL